MRIWLSAYAVVVCAVVLGMLSARGCALRQFGTDKAHGDWQDWKRTANAQSEADWSGPVRRKPRTHDEPPALVLMRDYFGACLTLALVVSSAIFATFGFALRGVLHNSESKAGP